MKIIKSIQKMSAYSQAQLAAGKSIGFVPTMGYLHEGHGALMDRARKENDCVVISIFVNPLQFGPNEDFERYPRDFARDENVAINNAVDVVFYPEVHEMYPNNPSVVLHVKRRVQALCGKTREGHFDGVATVLSKLFHIVSPTRAYFGMKDAQQVAVVEGLITDLNYPMELVACPTVREEDGLAKSSRNVYLSPQERREAPVLFRSLKLAAELLEKEKNITLVKEKMVEYVETETSGNVDYFEILSYPELEEVPYSTQTMIIALAVQYKNARLIDNLLITPKEREL
ncbi:pantoate--beta-alanine ligase [Fictibacillus enclensis]|uniref:Pantothenate synthetase n=1 Tax=Fictibacillus enclensis TaxID=1017270 RepID=A0A0V8JEV1_9BACL|nr:pantoate--beta-alanine ligase [Fictibacillus enclensis]KSU85557.1 pantoate--beta-alanine ligase [Fictibacillus enclensis]SCB98798.1 pantoate--beta-alanine ligase [Fictibacillus enclensis]